MSISEYSNSTMVQAYFTAIAQATTLVLCNTLSDPAWSISQVNADKLFEVPLIIVSDTIGGDFSFITVNTRPALHIEPSAIPTSVVQGTGTCIVLHDDTTILKVFAVPEIVLSSSEVFNVPPFDIIFT